MLGHHHGPCSGVSCCARYRPPDGGCRRAAHAAFDSAEAVCEYPTLPDPDALQEALKHTDVPVGDERTHA